MEVCDKRDSFNLVTLTCAAIFQPNLRTYGVYISQLVRISRICDECSSFVSKAQLLVHTVLYLF